MTLDEYISVHSSPENAVLEHITRATHVHILNPYAELDDSSETHLGVGYVHGL